MKVVFYLMNQKGLSVLQGFLNEFGTHKIEYVVLSQDKNVRNDYYSEIKDLCGKYDIRCFDRTAEKPPFAGYGFAVGWRWMIEEQRNLIILHDSLLPKYRGFAPLVSALINGENRIGVTALFASSDYDRGEIIAQLSRTISYPIKIQTAIQLVAELYVELVNRICAMVLSNEPILAVPQVESEATYSLWRDELDYFIDWRDSASRIRRMVDALGYPYSGARSYIDGSVIILNEVEEVPDIHVENRAEGKVVFFREGRPVVVCGQGLLMVKDAVYLDNRPVFPLAKFRTRFG